MARQADKDGGASAPANIKKPYIAPVLQRWGTVADLTRAVGRNGGSDGGGGKQKKTRP